MPLAIKPIMKSNESSLWILYCNYCTNQRDLPTKAVPASVRHHKKLLESERIWVLLRDFGVCPDVCRKTVLYDLLAEVLAEDPNDPSNSNGKSPISPVTSDNKVKSPNLRSKPTSSLSFDNFLKLLWKIASVCLEIPLASPSKRIIFLLTKMDRYHYHYHYHFTLLFLLSLLLIVQTVVHVCRNYFEMQKTSLHLI